MANDDRLQKVISTCSISVDDIFKLLHIKAAKQVKDCKILNSAIEGDGKNSKFHGAGSHIIAALPLHDDYIEKELAIKSLITYVTWFNGPDVALKINSDTVWPLNSDDNDSKSNESIDKCIPSFASFLNEANENDESKQHSLDRHDVGEKAKLTDKKENKKAKGFYITYKISIEGQKESPLSDALKGFGAGLLKGLGIQGFSWKTGAKGKEHTIGDLVDTLSQVFGKIDPELLRSRFTANIKAKYPLTKNTDVLYFDQKTLLHDLKGKISTKDMQKIKSADYSLCYKVEKNDKSKKLINVNVVADCVTRSIKGLFKKFKNSVSANDVILVNDYDEIDKDLNKNANKLSVKKDQNPTITTSDEMTKKESLNLFANLMSKQKLVFESLTDTCISRIGSYIFESDLQLNNIFEAEDKKALVDRILNSIEKDDTLTKRLKEYDGDLTGSTDADKVTFKTKDGKTHELTNDVVKKRFDNPKFLIKLCKLPTLKRIIDVIDELDSKKDEVNNPPNENENLDLIDSIMSTYTDISTTISELKNKEKTIKDFNLSKQYARLLSELKNVSKLNKAFSSKDEFILILSKVQDRKTLVNIDNAFEEAKKHLDELVDKNSASTNVNVDHTGGIDMYVIPMKNLKMDNSDSADSKEVEGKGK